MVLKVKVVVVVVVEEEEECCYGGALNDDTTCLTMTLAVVADSTNLAADTKAVSNATDEKRASYHHPSLSLWASLSFSKWGEKEGTGRGGS